MMFIYLIIGYQMMESGEFELNVAQYQTSIIVRTIDSASFGTDELSYHSLMECCDLNRSTSSCCYSDWDHFTENQSIHTLAIKTTLIIRLLECRLDKLSLKNHSDFTCCFCMTMMIAIAFDPFIRLVADLVVISYSHV